MLADGMIAAFYPIEDLGTVQAFRSSTVGTAQKL
jgi:hypothetical protein